VDVREHHEATLLIQVAIEVALMPRRHEHPRMSTTLSAPATVGAREASGIALRPAKPDDVDAVARILYEAFAGIHDHHRFARDFPTLDAAARLAGAFIAHPSIWGVVAERDGRVIGSNFVDERSSVRGVGPITVDPCSQHRGVGRRLMDAVLDRSSGAAGVRLLQDSFNLRSLGLYASLGFRATDPVVVMSGRPRTAPPRGYEVRPMTEADVEPSAALHLAAHGFDRTVEVRDALWTPGLAPFVALRDGRIVAYATTLTFFPAAHAVADSAEAMAALIGGAVAAGDAPASFLLPIRQHKLFAWALDAGLRAVKPMTYMVMGRPHRPRAAWIPSVLS
jgi:predicted N-acetyltransferase YhbS